VLAAVPDQPSSVPVLNLEFTSASAIHVDYAALTEAENGGSPILSYELQVYRLETSSWLSITGGDNHFSLLTSTVYSDALVKGITYRLRYRAWNINGPGDWSLHGYVLAA
jgi:hypothetical protein